MEIDEGVLNKVRHTIIGIAAKKGYTLAVAGILLDHVHLLLACSFDDTPENVALGFLNNLAYAQGIKPMYQAGAYVGTVGEYTFGALS